MPRLSVGCIHLGMYWSAARLVRNSANQQVAANVCFGRWRSTAALSACETSETGAANDRFRFESNKRGSITASEKSRCDAATSYEVWP